MRKDSNLRTLCKTMSYRVGATCITAGLVYAFTGKWDYAVSIGGLEVLTKLVFYYAHERIWATISLGRPQVLETDGAAVIPLKSVLSKNIPTQAADTPSSPGAEYPLRAQR